MKILNFGSLNIDYVYSVEHFVQKGETLSSDMLNVYSGGKGLNQSIALSRAGLPVYHAGMIGEDGTFLENMLKDAGVNTQFLYKSSEVRTGNAIIQNDKNGDNCILLYGGANQAITKDMIDQVLANFEAGDWLVLQNEICEIPYIVEQAHHKGMKIMLNPSPMNDRIYELCLDYIDVFILNEVEAQGLVGTTDDVQKLQSKLKEKFPNAEIVLTLGEKGSMYLGEESVQQEIYSVETVDTTAAGDTFTGYYLAGRLQEMSVKETLNMAAAASAIAVSKRGAAPSIPTKDEVIQFIENH
ncbi:MAG: ribokinase [Candidatus Ruminococcus intestinipullorum]|nr:ribokinase [Candidatus Ruminococcus intestinipullorum]